MSEQASNPPAASDVPAELQGWSVDAADPVLLGRAVEAAFDFRGDVTITLADGSAVEGFVYDRRADVPPEKRVFRILPKDGSPRRTIFYSQVRKLEFSGRDTAAGKSFQTWIANYARRKMAGEAQVQLTPEPLD